LQSAFLSKRLQRYVLFLISEIFRKKKSFSNLFAAYYSNYAGIIA